MSPGRAYVSGGALIAFLVVAVVLLFTGTGGGPDGRTVVAEFADVNPLLEGNNVRMNGAPAGVVEDITLTDRGTVRVTMKLNDGLPELRRDATAAIRAQDLLGENYLALSAGRAGAPLTGPIRLSRTTVAPRLSSLLDTYDKPTRAGVQALLVEAGRIMDGRGEDLNEAVVRLRPGLQAIDRFVREASSQNAALEQLLVKLHGATGQLATRDSHIDTLLTGLRQTVEATADRLPQLDEGLSRLPAMLSQAQRTAGRLTGFTREATPLASDLATTAPQLVTTAEELPGFLRQARSTVRQLRPTLRTATSTLAGGRPTLQRISDGLAEFAAITPKANELLAKYTDEQDSRGPLNRVGAPNIGVGGAPTLPGGRLVTGVSALQRLVDAVFDKEVGLLNTYTGIDLGSDDRNLVRGLAMFSCSSFGLPNEPGCLPDALSDLRALFDDVSAGRRKAAPGSALALLGRNLRSITDGLPLIKSRQPSRKQRPGDGGGTAKDPVKTITGAVEKLLGGRKGEPGGTRPERPAAGGVVQVLEDVVGGLLGKHDADADTATDPGARSGLLDFLLEP